MEQSDQEALRPESYLGYQVSLLGRLLGRELRSHLESSMVATGQFAPLLVLYRSDGLTQAELCARVQVEQATMAKTLDRMQRDGLITRQVDQRDRRRTLIRLTDRAREIEGSIAAAVDDGNSAALRGIPEPLVADFMKVLALMIENLSAGEPGGPTA